MEDMRRPTEPKGIISKGINETKCNLHYYIAMVALVIIAVICIISYCVRLSGTTPSITVRNEEGNDTGITGEFIAVSVIAFIAIILAIVVRILAHLLRNNQTWNKWFGCYRKPELIETNRTTTTTSDTINR